MQVHTVRCFGAAAGHGNVALVIEDGPATPEARQAFARAQPHPACVFLDPGLQRYWFADYYYPHARSPLCLHATLGAAQVLFARAGQAEQDIVLATAMRGQPLRLCRQGDDFFVALQPQGVPEVAVDGALAAWLLDQPALRLAAAPVLASVGSPKLLLEVLDRATLHALRPPLDRILDWGRAHGVSGCYVVCRSGDDTYEGRNFNHLDPAMEDRATGVAAGALTAHLGRAITLHQGGALGAPCLIRTQVEDGAILVGGRAEAVPAN
ncbi:PhzF family phenazine biosynthesis protein [Massilia pseudoviolaceinigra]|uniref:PhzF family phenazine biosynthesis protein n=1 Tax=Massilia pseudoviolaceinigra TaxID=3057165 RepID=UPI002796828D|nr:PhzF family phenazine biosynthesis protein [Massilia sp. CCM 9206]MDQ1923752.1 PhzF family phenazine biosynthesis protein [Massilia sp. CCM 9206]